MTALDSLVAKLARVPDAPAPVFPYSANVTWSVMHTTDRSASCVCDQSPRGKTYFGVAVLQIDHPAATTFEPSVDFWKTTRA